MKAFSLAMIRDNASSDLFAGDWIPLEVMKRNPSLSIEEHDWPEEAKERFRKHNLQNWLTKHTVRRIEEVLQPVVTTLRSEHPEVPFYGIGYCYGGKIVIRTAKDHLNAALSFHPVRYFSPQFNRGTR